MDITRSIKDRVDKVMSKDIEIAIEVLRETEKAYLVFDGKREEWVPKSLVKDYTEENDGSISSIFLSEYIAEQKGFI